MEDHYINASKLSRNGSDILQSLTSNERNNIILSIAHEFMKQEVQNILIEKNLEDLEFAKTLSLSNSSYSRLKLTKQKLVSLSTGLKSLANQNDLLGNVLSKLEIGDNLILEKRAISIGIIFESRPDVLGQVLGLAIKSGNGMILKGGKESEKTNLKMMEIIENCIRESTNNKLANAFHYFSSREAVAELLKLDNLIDLVIPRGSNQLVNFVTSNTKIPVLSHADGVCHIFVDEFADFNTALRVIMDAKTNYPSACNAVETVLFHSKFDIKLLLLIVEELLNNKVAINIGPKLKQVDNFVSFPLISDFHVEYGDFAITLELCEDINIAIDHINKYSSLHTESIITQDDANIEVFTRKIQSSSVLINASTRFADGFRYGLGAELGIATGRLAPRGPIGVEGGDIVSEYESNDINKSWEKQNREYKHKILN